ncbi:hypothetical protein E2C01_017474 [Portunus trituberculatus]|uniref:Uncharacterized protein n=1 Tax=Portunus trituberculatus TaxID=210409 RepID=A0A5B7DTT4_PORTR|nr:hypothetical protein [Portunus trituberculatus]
MKPQYPTLKSVESIRDKSARGLRMRCTAWLRGEARRDDARQVSASETRLLVEEGEKFSITDTYYTEIPQRSERSAGADEMRASTIIPGFCVAVMVVYYDLYSQTFLYLTSNISKGFI